jgi:hypothetical protein
MYIYICIYIFHKTTCSEKMKTKRNQSVKKQIADTQFPIIDPPNSAPTTCRIAFGFRFSVFGFRGSGFENHG